MPCRPRVSDTLKRVYVCISRYAGIMFLLFLLLALSYEQVKELINAVLPAKNVEQIKLCIKLIFRSESVFSAVEAVAIYSLLASCCSGLGAILIKAMQTFFEDNVVAFSDKREIKVVAPSCREQATAKSFLVYSRYNSYKFYNSLTAFVVSFRRIYCFVVTQHMFRQGQTKYAFFYIVLYNLRQLN